MPNLAIFDFDQTVVNDDSDSVIIRKLTEKETPPRFDSTTDTWTPYMGNSPCAKFGMRIGIVLVFKTYTAYTNCRTFGMERKKENIFMAMEGMEGSFLEAMAGLAVFDFDRTVVSDDSDAVTIRKVREKKPSPGWDSANHEWDNMINVFEHAFTAGLHQDDILDGIASMIANTGMIDLFEALSAAGWDILLLTDANSVFVEHWVKSHGLEKAVTSIITNRAFWRNGRLYIEPNMEQASCRRCPPNLCKSIALCDWRAGRDYKTVAYIGDGRNDYCPACTLNQNDYVFPRRGFPLDELIKLTQATPKPNVVAKVVPWDDGYTIIRELFPEKKAGSSVNQIDSRSSEMIKVS